VCRLQRPVCSLVLDVRRFTQLWSALILFVLGFSPCGCASIPKGRVATDRIDLEGNEAIKEKTIKQRMALRQTPRFLGLFRGVLYDYELFNRYVLERDLQRIERYYRARGYYEAKVRAGRVEQTGDKKHVRVEILIDEGDPALVRRIDLHGLEALPKELAEDAREEVEKALPLDEPFEEEAYENAQKALVHALTDRGYAYATVRRNAEVDIPRKAVAVGFWVTPRIPARYGDVKIVGLAGLPEGPVRRAVKLTPGDSYSSSELEETQRALLNLGVFGSVNVEPVLPEKVPDDPPELVPIRVRVEPSKLKAVHLGGGVQIDSIKTDVHLNAGWENRNFLGGLRNLSVDVTPGIVLYPTRIPSLNSPERLLPEISVSSTLRQPGLIEARTNAFVRAEGSIYPVLPTSDPPKDAPILGYREYGGSIGVDRSVWRFYGILSQNLQVVSPFSYHGVLDPDLDTVVVSYPELFAALDLRNDRIVPHYGSYLANTLAFAGVFGNARDVKVQPEARGYIPLDDDLTLALRGTVGLLFPQNYGKTLVPDAFFDNSGGASRAEWVRDLQILFIRGFFSGGNGSNRGYASREIGPHGIVPFYNPGQSVAELDVNCDPANPDYDAGACDLPLGGLTLWEASVELRYPISGAFAGVVFVDTSDVSPYRADFRWDRPHLSAGFGFRYQTPIGPVRFDLGYRVPGLQYPEGSPDELRDPSTTLGLPIALSFGIGESF
jgi:outer membrane protein assembly factor BamA